MSTIKKYNLENLCCENCAAAIERETKKVAGVVNAIIDNTAATITVEFTADEAAVLKAVSSIAVEIDDDIVVTPA